MAYLHFTTPIILNVVIFLPRFLFFEQPAQVDSRVLYFLRDDSGLGYLSLDVRSGPVGEAAHEEGVLRPVYHPTERCPGRVALVVYKLLGTHEGLAPLLLGRSLADPGVYPRVPHVQDEGVI